MPLTGNVSKLYPAEAYVTINGKTSKAMADQLTTASKQRLQSRITRLDGDTLDAVEHAIKVQLGLTSPPDQSQASSARTRRVPLDPRGSRA